MLPVVFVLRFYSPVNPMGSCRAWSVYLTTRLLGRLSPQRLTSIVHILSPETDNCPSWISGRERMTVENISWSISTKECCRPRRGLNPRPPGLQSDGASKWATEASCTSCNFDKTGPSCSKLTMSLVNDLLKFTSSDTWCWNFLLKKCE